jgi:hypothetical protein
LSEVDTRTKIGATAGSATSVAVSGYFDPLLAAHARQLKEIASGGRVTVYIADPTAPLLPARARAELVAALAVVERVVLPNVDGSAAIPPGVRCIRLERDHAQRSAAFERHIRERHSD